jgi:hypothetical protein
MPWENNYQNNQKEKDTEIHNIQIEEDINNRINQNNIINNNYIYENKQNELNQYENREYSMNLTIKGKKN